MPSIHIRSTLDLDGDDPVVIHAMPLRPKFHGLLG